MASYWHLLTTVSIPILFACACGAILSAWKSVDTRTLTDVSLFVLAPGLIIVSMVISPANGHAVGQVTAYIAIHTALCAGVGFVAAKVFRFSPGSQAGLVLTTSFGNAVNYGLPVILLAYGQAGFSLGAAYVIDQVILVNTMGMYVASRAQVSPKQAVQQVLKAPLIYAAAVGILLYVTKWHLPEGIQSGLKMLGDAYPAIVLMILGIQIRRIRLSGIRRPAVWVALGLRIVAVPILAKLSLLALGIHGLLASVLFVQSSMPAAINTSVLVEKFGGDKEQVALTVAISTALSFLYLPLFIHLG